MADHEQNVVRRVNSSLSALGGHAEGDCAPVVRRDNELTVTSQKSLGVQPRVVVSWSAPAACWSSGFRLLVFRSTDGFAPELYPKSLAAHGQMIREEMADGTLDEALAEGTYYYTLVLHRRTFLTEQMRVVRFSETIPSAKVAIGRIEDQLKLARLGQEYQLAQDEGELRVHQSKQRLAAATAAAEKKADDGDSLAAEVRRDVEQTVRRLLVRAHTRIELLAALDAARKQLKKHPSWKRLDKEEQDKILRDIAADLDANEEELRVD